MRRIRNIYKFRCIIIGVIAVLLFNYKFLEALLIPDICNYHFQQPFFVFGLFYSLPTWNGGHPVPTVFNLFVTLGSGAAIGYKLYLFLRVKFWE